MQPHALSRSSYVRNEDDVDYSLSLTLGLPRAIPGGSGFQEFGDIFDPPSLSMKMYVTAKKLFM